MDSADLLFFFALHLPFMRKPFFPLLFVMLMMSFLVVHGFLTFWGSGR
jgi:hypothetical protein